MRIQDEFIEGLALQGKRIDGRELEEFRNVQVEKNPFEKPEGCARVRFGDTDVLVGVKLDVGEPFPDKLDEGVLIVSAELAPIASPDFEAGPPREPAIELARVIDRGIREAKTIDMKKLCIIPGEKVWSVFVYVHILNHAGNLIDACSLAAITALKDARMPSLEGGRTAYGKKTQDPLPLRALPVEVTVHKLKGGSLFVDPTREEEEASEARLTVSTTENGNVTALQKGGAPLTLEEIEKAIQIALKRGKELRKLI